MRASSKIKSLLLTILIALFAVSAVFGVSFASKTATAEQYELVVSTDVEDMYYVGDIFRVPSASFTDGGNTYAATATIIYPNGNEVIADKITFDSIGNYVIKYKTTINNNVVTNEKTEFKVVEKLYSFDNPSASGEIVNYTFEEYYASYSDSQVEGLWVELPEGATFSYNKVIDLSNNTYLDEIVKFNVISTYNPTSDSDQKSDFGLLTIKLIDIYDENNYITYEFFDQSSTHPYIYVRGSGSNQGKCYSYAMGPNNNYGSLVYASKTNRTYQNWASRADDTFTIGFDAQTHKLYACRSIISSGDRMMEFCDLNSTSLFSETWGGFTTGEVKMTIYPSRFDLSSTGSGIAQLLIREVQGEPITSVVENAYSGIDNYYIESISPKIDVDLGEYTLDTLPSAVVGNAYNVFPATAVDVGSGIKDFTTKVFFHYYDDQIKVDIVDGKFTPKENQPGVYTIEYKAIDMFGNESIKLVDIQCTSGSGYDISLLNDATSNPLTGHTVKVKTPSVLNASGVASIAITALDSKGNKYTIPTNTLEFIPLSDGAITVTYKATDYVGRVKEVNDVINVSVDQKPVFLTEASFVKYFLQSITYAIPELKAKDFVANKDITPKVEYKFGDDGQWEVLNSTSLLIKVSENKQDYTLYVKYTATSINDADNKTVLNYEVPCKYVYNTATVIKNKVPTEITYYDRSKLFIKGSSVTSAYELLNAGTETAYATYTFGANDYIEYVNPLTAIDFNTQFAITGGTFSSIKYTFTDITDPNVSVALTLTASGNSATVQATGGLLYLTSSVNLTKLGYLYKVEYDAANLAFKVADNGDKYVIKNTLNGDEFTGFPSQKFYLRIDVEGVTANESKFAVYSIGNFFFIDVQNANYRQSATAKTLTVYDGQSFYKGKVYTLTRTIILDPINAAIVATMTVKHKDTGKIIKDVNGLSLQNVSVDKDYDIIFNDYGSYQVMFTIPGQNAIYKNINVVDVQAPVLQVVDLASRYSVGKSATIKAVAEDDSGAETTIYVSVYDSLHRYATIQNNSEYKFEKAGEYTFVFTAFDSDGNASIIRKYVTVK